MKGVVYFYLELPTFLLSLVLQFFFINRQTFISKYHSISFSFFSFYLTWAINWPHFNELFWSLVVRRPYPFLCMSGFFLHILVSSLELLGYKCAWHKGKGGGSKLFKERVKLFLFKNQGTECSAANWCMLLHVTKICVRI